MNDTLVNIDKPSLHVNHAELERADPDNSTHKSICPVCKSGWLLMQREKQTFQLLPTDRCNNCGQAYIYDDIFKLMESSSF